MATESMTRELTKILVTPKDSVQATIYRPAENPSGVLVIHPATATPQRFYRAFAEYAVSRGFVVVTYDFRGTGLSGEPKDNPQLRMRDWMQQDVPAVASWAHQNYPNIPHFALGHSIGGHAMVLNYGTDFLLGAVIISSHVAAMHTIKPWTERLRVGVILNLAGPVLSRTLGYMPGRRLGLGEDIPAASIQEWGRWSLKPNYFFDDPSMQAEQRAATTSIPLLVVGASDDLWASPAQMDALTAYVSGTRVERRTITPTQVGVSKIGHHGLMRRTASEQVWEPMLRWFNELAQTNGPETNV